MLYLAALAPGTIAHISPADVEGVIPSLFAEICAPARGNCSVAYYWYKPGATPSADVAPYFLLNDVGITAIGNVLATSATRRNFSRLSTVYDAYRFQFVGPRGAIEKPPLSQARAKLRGS